MAEFCSQKFSTPPKTGSPSIVDDNNNNKKDDGVETDQPLLSTNNETNEEETPVETAIQPDQPAAATVVEIKTAPQIVQPEKPPVVVVNGRDILDLYANLRNSAFNLRYTDLPEKNMNLFFANRSQYHRLGANGHVQEYTLVKCNCCDFEYPINGYLTPNNNNNNNKNNITLSTAINNNFMGNNIANNAKNMINNVANTNVNNMMPFGNTFNQQQLNNNANNTSYMYYQNMKTASPYYNNNNNNSSNNNMMNNNNNHNMMNNNNARMLSQQFNKNMAPTYGLYKHF
jgi:hypothetical protein